MRSLCIYVRRPILSRATCIASASSIILRRILCSSSDTEVASSQDRDHQGSWPPGIHGLLLGLLLLLLVTAWRQSPIRFCLFPRCLGLEHGQYAEIKEARCEAHTAILVSQHWTIRDIRKDSLGLKSSLVPDVSQSIFPICLRACKVERFDSTRCRGRAEVRGGMEDIRFVSRLGITSLLGSTRLSISLDIFHAAIIQGAKWMVASHTST